MAEKVRPLHNVLETWPLITGVITEAIPDITPLLRPTAFGDIAAYTFFSIAGLFLGGETGILTGIGAAKRTISQDSETKARVEKAYREFRADVLRKDIELLESEKGSSGMLE
jgi:hypothetical protein